MQGNGHDARLSEDIRVVYCGPLEGFVARRDALTKQLRTAGRREDAVAIKALRKPSRTAWALNLAAAEARAELVALEVAVAATIAAHGDGRNVRAAIVGLQAAVRDFAAAASRAADQAGHPVDQAVLTNAVLSVLGSAHAFTAMRGACLADVPEAGGLDFFTSLPAPMVAAPQPPAAAADAPVADATEKKIAAEDAARRAASGVAVARAGAEAAQRVLRETATNLEAARAELRRAEASLRDLQDRHDRASREADHATAQLVEAEKAAAEAERLLDG